MAKIELNATQMAKIELNQDQLEFIYDALVDFLGEQHEFLNQFAWVVDNHYPMSSQVKKDGKTMIDKTLSLYELLRVVILNAEFLKVTIDEAIAEPDFNIEQFKKLREKLKTCPLAPDDEKVNCN